MDVVYLIVVPDYTMVSCVISCLSSKRLYFNLELLKYEIKQLSIFIMTPHNKANYVLYEINLNSSEM